jgi:hypothetical protein
MIILGLLPEVSMPKRASPRTASRARRMAEVLREEVDRRCGPDASLKEQQAMSMTVMNEVLGGLIEDRLERRAEEDGEGETGETG